MAQLEGADLRAALRLTNEAREFPRRSKEQREHVARGLALLTNTQVGVWIELDASAHLFPVLDFGWSTSAERAVFQDYAFNSPDRPQDPVEPLVLRMRPSGMLAGTRQDLIEDRAWYRSAHVQEIRRSARIDNYLFALWPEGDRFSALTLHREWDDRGFSERDCALVEAICGESRFLREPTRLESLPARLREVLDGLSVGKAEKQIAADLDLSIHTVHDYVKALHRRLHVQSRGELLAIALKS
jgi:DNA-binding CsgD family transcriptional regulator